MKLFKRTYLWLGISILLGLLGWMVYHYSASPDLLPKYARQLSKYYEEEARRLDALLNDSLHWEEIYQVSQRRYSIPKEEEIDFLQKWSQEDVILILYKDDMPLYWTKNTLIIPKAIRNKLYQGEELGAIRLNNGYYKLKSRTFGPRFQSFLLIGAIPIKYEYPVEGPLLQAGFAGSASGIPSNLVINNTEGEPVLGPRGEPIFYLNRDSEVRHRFWYLFSFVLFLTALFFLIYFLNKVANYLARRFHPWFGAGWIIGTVLLLRQLAGSFGFYESYSDISFFKESLNAFIFKQSLGEFFLNSLVLLWLMVFFHREFKLNWQPLLARPWPAVFTTLAYALSLTSFLIVIRLYQRLIMESNLIFDFEFIFGLHFNTLLALISGLIIILAVFLFNHRLLQTTSRLGLSLPSRLLAVVAAFFICGPIFYVLQLHISPWIALMMAIVFILGFDYTLDRPSLSLTMVVLWLLFFAVCTSFIIYIFQQKQDTATKQAYAEVLCNPRDSLFEERLTKILPDLRSLRNTPDSIIIKNSFSRPSSLTPTTVNTIFSTESYLFQHYEFELFGIEKKDNTPLFAGQKLVKSMRLLEDFSKGKRSNVKDLYYWQEPMREKFTYVLDLAPQDTSQYVLMAFRHRIQKDQRVYGDLLTAIPYKNLSQLPLYDYAIYGNLQQLKQEGKLPASLRIPFATLEKNQYLSLNTQGHNSLVFKNEKGFSAILSRQKIDLRQVLSLFSFLFSILVVLAIIFSTLNYYTQALPNTLEFSSLNRASLRNRIQRAILLLILGSFLLVGLVTAAFFRRNALRAGSEQLNEKAQSVLADLQRNVRGLDEQINGLEQLASLVEPIADIHNMDINVYDLKGQLQLTSAEYMFRQRVTARLMDPIALQALRLPTESSYRSKESISKLDYQSAFVPIRDGNEEIIAYLELPYYANDRELRNDLQSFLSALLNVYVFLLLVAGAIALVVAESITQPISKIGQKLSQFRLGHNEPLEWKSPDEIGQLIAEYNRMIKKLDESAEKLRQSEREGAWREMAKQVAHEIKNPLTPMKLNIQHLLRVQKQDPQKANSMLAEVAQSIIQQINGLSRIAGEFSNFAKMPQAKNETFDLNKLVASVFHLYEKGDHGSTKLQLKLPEKNLFIFADSTQLMRVINNLIKNALQAIPDDRPGTIEVHLMRKEDLAVLSVSDNGSGIPSALQGKVFFPNFTTKNSGMGLGLAMSRSIVNTAGGRIYFKTVEEQGTTFFVELPMSENKQE